ncbi:MAG: hypothetical protein ACE5HT_17365, partial [Gemmatimonadales bacterium]
MGTTYITRGDAEFEGLVTHVKSPNGLVQHAGYDDRGNIVVSTDSSTNATTRYTWDPKWDFSTSVIPPEGDRVDMAYDATTGNRLWQDDARGQTSRVTFSYWTTGNKGGLLRYVDGPLEPASEIDYDALGNVLSNKT